MAGQQMWFAEIPGLQPFVRVPVGCLGILRSSELQVNLCILVTFILQRAEPTQNLNSWF